MKHTSNVLDFSRVSGALTIRVRTLRTLGSRQPPTASPTPVLARSRETIFAYLCAADATRYSTRLARRLFGKIATLLDGRGRSTKSAATSMQKCGLSKSSKRHFGFSGEW